MCGTVTRRFRSRARRRPRACRRAARGSAARATRRRSSTRGTRPRPRPRVRPTPDRGVAASRRTGSSRGGAGRGGRPSAARLAASIPEPTLPANRNGSGRAGAVVVADEQRAELAFEAPGTGQPAADHQLLALCGLHLAPGVGPLAGEVAAVEPFGHHAFQPQSFGWRPAPRRRHPPWSVASARRRPRGRGARAAYADRCTEARTSSGRRARARRTPCTPRVGRRRPGARRPADPACMRGWSRSKRRDPRLVERDELAVEQGVDIAECGAEARELGEARGGVVAGARGRPHAAPLDADERPHAVPLHLVGPLGVVGRQDCGGGREHGTQVAGDAGTGGDAPRVPSRDGRATVRRL